MGSYRDQWNIKSGATQTIQEDPVQKVSVLNQSQSQLTTLQWNASPGQLAGLRCSLLEIPYLLRQRGKLLQVFTPCVVGWLLLSS